MKIFSNFVCKIQCLHRIFKCGAKILLFQNLGGGGVILKFRE